MTKSLYVEQTGSGCDLFLLHGWMMNSRCWDGLATQLEGRFRLTKVDLPGHGGSLRSSYSFEDPDRLLVHLLELAPERAVWIGWSLGGLLAQLATRVATDRIRALVIVGMSSRYLAAKEWPHGVSHALFRAVRSLFSVAPEQVVRRLIEQQVLGSERQTYARSVLRSLAMMRWDKKQLKAGLELLQATDARQTMQMFEKPALFVVGEKDMIVSTQSVRYSSHIAPRGIYAEIAGAGHAPFLSHAGEFLKVLRGFIDGCRFEPD